MSVTEHPLSELIKTRNSWSCVSVAIGVAEDGSFSPVPGIHSKCVPAFLAVCWTGTFAVANMSGYRTPVEFSSVTTTVLAAGPLQAPPLMITL